jgi:OmcA/MtrC family decaheme c-type cytochrome
MQQDHDFSTVEFPQAVNNCTACHATNAVQASAWKDDPSIATCTSCHDTTVFKQSDVVAGKTVLHTGLEQADGTCDICHRSGSIHPVDARHYVGTLDPTKPQLAVTIDSITNTGPGQAPTVAFTVNYGGAPRNIIASPLTRLRVTFAGPNTDFATFWQGTVQGTGANGTLAAVTDGSDGKFKYTVAAAQAIPAAATGSYTVGMEGYVQDAAGVRWATMNPVQAFAVTDATAQPRREVVALDSCNACHGTLNFHGPAGQGARRDPKYCVLCHNANNTGNGTAKLESSTVLSESVDFKAMIHKIHMGERRTMPWTWVSGVSAANPAGTTTTFDVRYPRDQATCTACHQGKTYQLPIVATALPTLNEELTCTEDPNADTNNYCDAAGAWIVSQQLPLAPEVAVCTSCHDAPYVAIHAATNTVNGQTACTTCHGPGAQLDVDVVHHLQ